MFPTGNCLTFFFIKKKIGMNNERYNVQNGGPAPERVTDEIYNITKAISRIKSANLPDIDLSTIARHEFVSDSGNPFVIEIIDNTEDYVAVSKLLKF